ncbi:MAG: c-type cytochrome [Phycisphaerales bacterium]
MIRVFEVRRSVRVPAGVIVAAAFLIFALGCGDDMADQPRYEPLEESSFYPDGRSTREPVPGTVARGSLEFLRFDPANFEEGGLPIEVDLTTLNYGRERYNIHCSMCHGGAGDGVGIVPSRGYTKPTSYHIERLREQPPAYFVKVIINGYGRMPDYKAQVPPFDRWAIAAYIKALQLSQHAPAGELSAADLAALDQDPFANVESMNEEADP